MGLRCEYQLALQPTIGEKVCGNISTTDIKISLFL